MVESFNYHRALSWEKFPAMKRLIVFESPSEGRKWVNGRDNWVADSWVGYGLLCFSKGEKKRRWRRVGTGRKGCERSMLWNAAAGVVWLSLARGRTTILFSPRGDPWPLACSSLLQVQALTAGSSHTDTHYKLIFHTLGEMLYENADSFHISTPLLLFFSFMPFYCQG